MQAYSKLTALAALFGLFNSSLAGYTLQDDYSGSNFFDMFDFFTVRRASWYTPRKTLTSIAGR